MLRKRDTTKYVCGFLNVEYICHRVLRTCSLNDDINLSAVAVVKLNVSCFESDWCCRTCRDSKIASSEKMRIGGTAEMAWMQICDPSDKEKGHYSIEVSDGVQTHTRTFDLSGQGA